MGHRPFALSAAGATRLLLSAVATAQKAGLESGARYLRVVVGSRGSGLLVGMGFAVASFAPTGCSHTVLATRLPGGAQIYEIDIGQPVGAGESCFLGECTYKYSLKDSVVLGPHSVTGLRLTGEGSTKHAFFLGTSVDAKRLRYLFSVTTGGEQWDVECLRLERTETEHSLWLNILPEVGLERVATSQASRAVGCEFVDRQGRRWYMALSAPGDSADVEESAWDVILPGEVSDPGQSLSGELVTHEARLAVDASESTMYFGGWVPRGYVVSLDGTPVMTSEIGMDAKGSVAIVPHAQHQSGLAAAGMALLLVKWNTLQLAEAARREQERRNR